MAVTYTVNSTLDGPDKNLGTGGCETTAVGECTLRAAIEESNFSTGTKDSILFTTAFNGQIADTITIGAGFPSIDDPVAVDGDQQADELGQCEPLAGILGPCVGVEKSGGGLGLVVEADEVTIEGLAVTGASIGIDVMNGSVEFKAHDNWLGVKLDGTAGGNTTGIFLDPNSNGATIGGTSAADRNVFGNNAAEGLDIEGADNADVLGNYFGVKPDGSTQAANGKNVEITDTVAFEANGDEVGTTIEGAAAATQACDGGCNVVPASTGPGIDLVGEGIGQNELPASGPTTLRGNYVGLNSGGVTTVSAGPLFDILAGAAKDVTVGGTAVGDANYIAGGSYGIYQENSNGFQALGNVIGRRPGGAGVAAPGSAGIFLFSLSSTDRETVEGNTIRLDGGAGIEQRFGGADIAGNSIEEGQDGILTKGSPGVAGANSIEGNSILGAEANGILIENDENTVQGNKIFESGGAGVRIQNPAPLLVSTSNLIGGDDAGEENTIFGNGGAAIEIVDPFDASEESANEVARNHGGGNGGLFIDLVEEANGGILPPIFATSKGSSASGTGAEAGATIRVFRKFDASPGEVESFLAKATADGSGNWQVTYPASIPAGTIVAATQTSVAGGTSELGFATTTAEPGGGSGGGSTGGEKDKEKPKGKEKGKDGKDEKAPETTIVKKKIKGRTAKFRFVSSEVGSTFQCRLDKKPFKPCRSPKNYKHLKPGKHVFEVRAIDAAGNRDKTPATRRFRVLPRR
jgi:CSLREA domain-containing protein